MKPHPKRRWNLQLKYQIGVTELLGETLCNTHLERRHILRFKHKEAAINQLMLTERYPDTHAWRGQFKSSRFSSYHLFKHFFGRVQKVGCGHESSSGTVDVYFGELISDFLYQLPYSENTESCSHPMNMWVEISVDEKNQVKFETELNHFLDVIAQIEVIEGPED